MAASQSSRAEPFARRLTGSRFLAADPRAAGFLGVDGMRAGDSSTLPGETRRWLNSVLEARVETLAIRRLPNLVQKATSKPRLQLSSLERSLPFPRGRARRVRPVPRCRQDHCAGERTRCGGSGSL